MVGGSKATSLESEDGSTGSSDPSKKHRKDEAEASQTDRKNPLGPKPLVSFSSDGSLNVQRVSAT